MTKYLAATVRSREMLRVLKERELLADDDGVTNMALALLALSAFYGKNSFAQTIKIFVLIWRVWEDSISPEELEQFTPENKALALLSDWTPPPGAKIS